MRARDTLIGLGAHQTPEAWTRRLQCDAGEIRRRLPPELLELHSTVVDRARDAAADGLILSGSTARSRRYARGMTTKIAVSLPDELVAAARQAVADGRAASVSAFVADAIEEHGRYEQLAALLSEMAAEAGPPTDEDREWARRTLGLS